MEKNPHEAFLMMTKLLRHQHLNPCATAVTMTRQYGTDRKYDVIARKLVGTHVDSYADPVDIEMDWGVNPPNVGKIWRRFFAVTLFEDWDSITEQYVSQLWQRGGIPIDLIVSEPLTVLNTKHGGLRGP